MELVLRVELASSRGDVVNREALEELKGSSLLPARPEGVKVRYYHHHHHHPPLCLRPDQWLMCDD